jgi:hypothetical protein
MRVPGSASCYLPHPRRPQHRATLWALLLVLLLPLGCVSSRVGAERTLTYEGPQTYTLKPGEAIPGTDIRFVRRSSEGAELTIGGQQAVKQVADSLNWAGTVAPGAKLDLRLRVVWVTADALYAAGTAKVTVSDVAPQAGTVSTQAPLSYQAPATFSLCVGATASGTGLSYQGKTADGAKFGGVEGYPYRQVGDSVRWEGYLRPNVALRMDLRVVQFDQRTVRLAGVAHLWITP